MGRGVFLAENNVCHAKNENQTQASALKSFLA
jgi:hypothetical protein